MGQRPKELSPQVSLRHLLGAEIRALREAQGLSLARLAGEVPCDPSFLARVERAERPASAGLVRRLDERLGAAGTLVRLHHHVERTDASRPELDVASSVSHVANGPETLVPPGVGSSGWPEGPDVVVPARDLNGQVVFVSLSRRAFMHGLGGGAALAFASVPAASAASAAALGADPDPVEHFVKLRRVLIDSDNLLGPLRVVPTVQEQVTLIQQVRAATRGVDARRLLGLQTQYAELAGWLWQDIGDHQAARYWTDRALEWSHLAGDPALSTYVLARKSQLAGDMGDGLAAVDLAQAALDQAEPGSRLAVVAATYGAHGHALLGDRDASKRGYDQARELLDTMDPNPASPWGAWMDAAYLGVQQARSMSALGEHAAAAAAFAAAIAALPPGYRRDRGVYLARQALALAGGRETEQAALLGLQALSIGAATSSGRILTELVKVDSSLASHAGPAGWKANHAVSDFRSAMRETMRETSGRQA